MTKGLMFAACLGVAVLSTGCKDDDKPQSTGGGSTPSGAAPEATQQASGEHKRLPLGETTLGDL